MPAITLATAIASIESLLVSRIAAAYNASPSDYHLLMQDVQPQVYKVLRTLRWEYDTCNLMAHEIVAIVGDHADRKDKLYPYDLLAHIKLALTLHGVVC